VALVIVAELAVVEASITERAAVRAVLVSMLPPVAALSVIVQPVMSSVVPVEMMSGAEIK
jgi:hypothetical protein